MNKKADANWKRSVPGVCWADVWEWADNIYTEHHLWVYVTLSPPITTRQTKQGTVMVTVEHRLPNGDRQARIINWKDIPTRAPEEAPAIALRMLVEMSTQLDREAYEAERATLNLGAMF